MRRELGGFAIFSAAVLVWFAVPLSASQIVINNPGFETPVTFTRSCCSVIQRYASQIIGWAISNPQNLPDPGGTWAPTPAFTSAGDELFIYPMGGSDVAYSNGGIISQTLATNVAPNTTYVLSVGVGLRAELVPPAFNANYTITLLADTPGTPTVLGSWTDDSYGHNHLNPITGTSLFPLIRGGWQTIQFASRNITLAGVPLIIQLSANSLDFDNISLQAIQIIPEPGTYALMGSALLALGLILRHRKKTA
jgi:hypothetical protein